ncbi:MAG: tRNA (adenosine(37)-N6)-threonylcarbamoyltransferase complex dimerization subunit type 1 TsaB [Thermomicrobiales bacterium]|nr:tRNA (adenosine(37)-N6)-threonylcarbamoyltransferase complex dimerization subunit type 1 TsaB [Thermomicrobiales bacterium]
MSTTYRILARNWNAGRTQTTTLLPEIDNLLQEADMTPGDITGLVVATGPGTFTGLRVGLAVAKGIIAAHNVPLVGIPTLDVVLAERQEEDVVAVLPAGRGRVVWQRRGISPVNSTVAEMLTALASTPELLLVGEVPDAYRSEIETAHLAHSWQPRNPEILLRLGAARIAAGDLDDPITLEPTYLHGITVNAPVIEDRLKRS